MVCQSTIAVTCCSQKSCSSCSDCILQWHHCRFDHYGEMFDDGELRCTGFGSAVARKTSQPLFAFCCRVPHAC